MVWCHGSMLSANEKARTKSERLPQTFWEAFRVSLYTWPSICLISVPSFTPFSVTLLYKPSLSNPYISLPAMSTSTIARAIQNATRRSTVSMTPKRSFHSPFAMLSANSSPTTHNASHAYEKATDVSSTGSPPSHLLPTEHELTAL